MRPNMSKWTSLTIRNEIMKGLLPLCSRRSANRICSMPLADVLDRIKDVKGRKAVLVLALGIDTFSKMTSTRR